MKQHLNYIILSDGLRYYLFERMGKSVPFEAYNPSHSLCTEDSVNEILKNSSVPVHEIEKDPYEVIFNE